MKIKKSICLLFALVLTFSAFAKDFDAVYGIYQIKINDNAGSFCLFVEDPRSEKFVPVLNPLGNFSRNKFYLKAGNRVYPLSKIDGVPFTYEIFQTYATMTYSVKGVADVKFIFTFVNSRTGQPENADMAIVDALITNKGRVTKNYTLKAVFDTLLGETYVSHFSTEKLKLLNTEAVFSSMVADHWIKSANENISLKFLFNGPSISNPTNVSVANVNLLSTDNWEPNLVPGRGYNSLFSINNSAISATWPTYKLVPDAKCNVRFYISTAVLGSETPDTTSPFFTTGMAEKNLNEYKESEKFINAEFEEYAKLTSNDAAVEPVSAYKDAKNAAEVEENLPQIPPEKVNQEYINELLAQIEEVQKNPDKYSQEKVLQLNTELDAVLKMLGQ
ncbi:MAG: hypothetical protein K6G52_08065 [Treponemataceae bacterium]|nr:hypothetical protein [Treponemataceae bacterium]